MKNHYTFLKKLFHLILVFNLVFSSFSFIESASAEETNSLLTSILEEPSNDTECSIARAPACNGVCSSPIAGNTFEYRCTQAVDAMGTPILMGSSMPQPYCECVPLECEDATAPACNADCGAGRRCVANGAMCECQDVTCNMDLAPTCSNGMCPSGQTCSLTDNGMDCACINDAVYCEMATAPACNGVCGSGLTCAAGAMGCECMCGANPPCDRCENCVNGQCQLRAMAECSNNNHCANNPRGHACLKPYYCNCGCFTNMDCPDMHSCNDDFVCVAPAPSPPPGRCNSDVDCDLACESCINGICTLMLGNTCSRHIQCMGTGMDSRCEVCMCRCAQTFPFCNGWAADGRRCTINANNTGCIEVGNDIPNCGEAMAPACSGNCPAFNVCSRNSQTNTCRCVIRSVATCESTSAPLCGGYCEDLLNEICASYSDSMGSSCMCLTRCLSNSDCPGSYCINGACTDLIACANSLTRGPDSAPICNGRCDPGFECTVTGSGETIMCECAPLACEGSAPQCAGLCDSENKVCRSYFTDTGNPSCRCLDSCVTDADCPDDKWCNDGICVPREPCDMVTNLLCQGGSCPPGEYCGNTENGPNNCQCIPKPACSNAPMFNCSVGTCPNGRGCILGEPDANGDSQCICRPPCSDASTNSCQEGTCPTGEECTLSEPDTSGNRTCACRQSCFGTPINSCHDGFCPQGRECVLSENSTGDRFCNCRPPCNSTSSNSCSEGFCPQGQECISEPDNDGNPCSCRLQANQTR